MPSLLYSSEQSPKLYTVIGNVVKWIAAMHTGDLDLYFPDDGHLKTYVGHLYDFFGKNSNQISWPFLSWLIQLLNCLIFLHIRGINFFLPYHVSYQTYDFNTLSTICIYLFTCSLFSFLWRNLFIQCDIYLFLLLLPVTWVSHIHH